MTIKRNFVGIPTRAKWIKYSTPTYLVAVKARRKNKLMLAIDDRVGDYHDALTTGGAAIHGHVFLICRACCAWLVTKKRKSSDRWPAVFRLLVNGLAEVAARIDNLATIMPDLDKTIEAGRFDVVGERLERTHGRIVAVVEDPALVDVGRRFHVMERNPGPDVETVRLACDAVVLLKRLFVCPRTVRVHIEMILKTAVVRVYHLFQRHQVPVYDPERGFDLARLGVDLVQIRMRCILGSRLGPRRPLSKSSKLTTVGKHLLGALEKTHGDYSRGKMLHRAMWPEQIGIDDPARGGKVQLYGGGVGLKALRAHSGLAFAPSRRAGPEGGVGFTFDEAEYKRAAAKLLRDGVKNRNLLIDETGGKGQLIKIKYFDDADRARHQLIANGGKFHKMPDGEHLETYDTGFVEELYAMDVDGFIFAIADKKLREYDAVARHSTLLAGQAVLCAGCIVCFHGTLVAINNDSGHYQPTTQDLLKCLATLRARYKVDLSRVLTMDSSNPALKHKAGAILAAIPADLFASRLGHVSMDDAVGVMAMKVMDKKATLSAKVDRVLADWFRRNDTIVNWKTGEQYFRT